VVLWTRLAPDPLNGGGMPDRKIDVRWEIAEDEAMRRIVGRGHAIAEPRFADGAARRVTAWTSTRAGAVFLDCDLVARGCDRAVPLPDAHGVRGFPTWRRPLYNPSRP
jgi:alkaline phosphatase D